MVCIQYNTKSVIKNSKSGFNKNNPHMQCYDSIYVITHYVFNNLIFCYRLFGGGRGHTLSSVLRIDQSSELDTVPLLKLLIRYFYSTSHADHNIIRNVTELGESGYGLKLRNTYLVKKRKLVPFATSPNLRYL